MKRVIQFATTLLTFSIALGAEAPVPSGPQLTDPLATPQATALYRNLHRVAREGILFGHQDTLAYGVGWKATESTFDSDVHRVCGKFPAVFGWDIGHIGDAANIDGVPFESMKLWIAKGYARGGIHTISWHARVPGSRESSWTRKEVVKRLLPEGDLHDIYRAELDRVAAFFVDLKGPNGEPVPIIFRPFHEHTGDWFWWGAKWCTPDEYKRLWHFTADYLRKTKNLHHLLLCYSPDRFKDRSAYLERYPGDDYVDILGHDNYGALRSIATQHGYYLSYGDFVHPDRKERLAMPKDAAGPVPMSLDKIKARVDATRRAASSSCGGSARWCARAVRTRRSLPATARWGIPASGVRVRAGIIATTGCWATYSIGSPPSVTWPRWGASPGCRAPGSTERCGRSRWTWPARSGQRSARPTAGAMASG